MDRAYTAHIEEQQAKAFDEYVAATDAEWAARLNTIAPRVGDQAVDYHKYTLRFLKPGQPLPRRSKPYMSDDQSFNTL